jgi:uncharacterized membrane-anchored protein
MMKRYLPLLFATVTLIFVNGNIFKQQRLIDNGEAIFVELMPVDPRSLLQGDYMALNYNLRITSAKEDYGKAAVSPINYMLVVTLDERRRVTSSTFTPSEPLNDNQHSLIVKNNAPASRLDGFYPASNSYLFAEGLAYCYQQAKYAELRVDDDGKPLLYRLVDDSLQPLNCESKPINKTETLAEF